jgi:hypothetical protein
VEYFGAQSALSETLLIHSVSETGSDVTLISLTIQRNSFMTSFSGTVAVRIEATVFELQNSY